ncbi:MAG: RDD family protein [Elusimicrobia bacterium]|nr:RDD family protein [Elusimicrobiota bacterium]
MSEKNRDGLRDCDLARFSDRVVAFSLDAGLFVVAYYLSFMLAFQDLPSANTAALWAALWTGGFLVYQAFCSCEGRTSLGKKLLGLRVVGLDGEPLSLGSAILRATAYPVSSFMGLGFLWSFFSPERQCWHDLVAGSVVVARGERSFPGRVLVRAGALACLTVVAGAWMWNTVWATRYYRIMDLAYARIGMSEVAQLQKAYFQVKGRYATSLVSLSNVSGDPEAFLQDMAALFDLNAGFEIRTTPKGYTVHARAKDIRRTPMTISGP